MAQPTMSTYGATEETPSRLSAVHVPSLDLYDADDDEEYEYLPLPEVDEDFLDGGLASAANGQTEITECMFSVLCDFVLCAAV